MTGPVFLFDLDGTLIDSAPDLHRAANALLSDEHADPLTLAELRSFIGEGMPRLVEKIAAARDLPEDPGRLARYRAHYDLAPAALTCVFDGVPETLSTLAATGAKLGVCTNKPEAPTLAVLEALDLRAPFAAVVGGDTLPVRKPDPAPLRLTIERLGGTPAQAVFVGDSEIDAATARAAAVPFVLFTEGYHHGPVDRIEAAARFSHWSDAPGTVGAVGESRVA